jgi:adenylylsulfate reductase subunit A
LNREKAAFAVEELEEAMQKVMDVYAGGIGSHYQFNEKQLALAKQKIKQIEQLAEGLKAEDMHELMFVYELKERLTVCQTLLVHLAARKETRWHCFAENLDYPEKSDEWLKYVNTRMKNGEIEVIFRELVRGEERYEHSN